MAAGRRPGRPRQPFRQLAAYRIGQALNGTFGRTDPVAEARATSALPANLRSLFLSMRARDRRHAVGVLERLGDAPEVLRQAALLHDVGKVRAYLGTPGRTLVVLANVTGTLPLVKRLPGIGPRVRHYVEHPEIGAEMLRQAGASAELVEIVAEHQARHPRHPETVRLQAADSNE